METVTVFPRQNQILLKYLPSFRAWNFIYAISFVHQRCYAPIISLKLTESYWCFLHFMTEALSSTKFPLAFDGFLCVEHQPRLTATGMQKGHGNAFL